MPSVSGAMPPGPHWMDTHCHLDAAEFTADRDAVYARARAAGMVGCLIPAVSLANGVEVLDCCRRYPGCVPAYGIHPLHTPGAQPADLLQLDDWLATHPAVAVGEIGLDGFVAGLDWDRQVHFFRKQLELARKHDLPVILHARRAVEAVIQALKKTPVNGGVVHAFNGSRQQADTLIGLGFRLGFGGAMTFPGSRRIRELAACLPLSALVLETDAPDIPPVWLRGKGRNEPAELPAIAQVLADIRNLPVAEVLQACFGNTLTAFQRLQPFPFSSAVLSGD